MSHNSHAITRCLTALLLTLLIAACSQQPLTVPVDSRPTIPPLSAAASEPLPPPVCQPSTCLDGLTRRRESWRTTLMPSASASAPAAASMRP